MGSCPSPPRVVGMDLLGTEKSVLRVGGGCDDLTAEPFFETLAVKHPNKTCFR